MVCIREFGQPLGAIGDSLGHVVFGGALPHGTLHLRIVAPNHFPVDTTLMWPISEQTKSMIITMRPRHGTPVEPRCVVADSAR